jgi:hypothetical protein
MMIAQHHVAHFIFDPNLLFGIAGLIINAIIAFFAVRVWHVYKDQHKTMLAALDETRKGNEFDQRAWLVPSLDSESLVKAGAERRVTITISNTGGVPGMIEEVEARIMIEGAVDRKIIGFVGMIVTPGQPLVDSLQIKIPPEIDDQRLSASATVTCEISYKDVFDKKRRTRVGWYRREAGWYPIKGSVLT